MYDKATRQGGNQQYLTVFSPNGSLISYSQFLN